MDDDLNFLENGRQPKSVMFWKMEDDINIFANRRRPPLFWKMEGTQSLVNGT